MERSLSAVLTVIYYFKPEGTMEEKLATAKEVIRGIEQKPNGLSWNSLSQLHAYIELLRVDPEIYGLDRAAEVAKKYCQTQEGREWLKIIKDSGVTPSRPLVP